MNEARKLTSAQALAHKTSACEGVAKTGKVSKAYDLLMMPGHTLRILANAVPGLLYVHGLDTPCGVSLLSKLYCGQTDQPPSVSSPYAAPSRSLTERLNTHSQGELTANSTTRSVPKQPGSYRASRLVVNHWTQYCLDGARPSVPGCFGCSSTSSPTKHWDGGLRGPSLIPFSIPNNNPSYHHLHNCPTVAAAPVG